MPSYWLPDFVKASEMSFANVGVPKRGRPRLLEMHEELIEQYCDALEKGMYMETAAYLIGVAPSSIRSWLKQGNIDAKNGDETVYVEFLASVKQAIARNEETLLGQLDNAGRIPQFWQAAAWRLERRYPKLYGRQDRVSMDHSGNMNLGIADVNKPMSERVDDAAKRQEVVRLAGSLDFIREQEDSAEPGTDSVRTFGNEWADESPETLEVSEWEVS